MQTLAPPSSCRWACSMGAARPCRRC